MDEDAVKITASDAPVAADTKIQTSDFIKQVAAYFDAYLEGDVSIGGLPLRRLDNSYREGLPQTIDLSLFPQLQKNLHKNFTTGLPQQTFVVTQNRYTGKGGEDLPPHFATNVGNLTDAQLQAYLQTLVTAAEAARLQHGDAHDAFVRNMLVKSRQLLETEVVVPLMAIPLRQDGSSSYHTAKPFITLVSDYLFDAKRTTLKHLFYAYSSGGESAASLRATLQDCHKAKHLKAALQRLVEHIDNTDAYRYLYGLHRAAIADKRSTNLYFGTIKQGDECFPLFYTPVQSKHVFPSITLTFENRIYVNHPAVAYIARQLTAQTGRTIKAPDLPHVLYADDDKPTQALQTIVDDIATAFAIDDQPQVAKAQSQAAGNPLVTLTNELYFKNDKASVDDIVVNYKTLLQDKKLLHKTEKYLEGLVNKAPLRYVDDIAEAWQEKSAFDKLVPTIPLPINDEQKQVLEALDHHDCNHLLIEGGNNTGKNQLLAAAVLQALSKKQSVAVVSASQATTQRLRATIGRLFKDNTGDKKGHNPVLPLGRDDILEAIDDQYIETIDAHATFQDQKATDLAHAKTQKLQAAREALQNFTASAENINLREIDQTVLNERRFAGKRWIEDEPIDTISSDLPRLHRAIQYVSSNAAGHLLPYVEGEQRTAVEHFISLFREYEKANKNVTKALPEFIVRYRKLLPEQRESLQNDLAYLQSNYRQFVKTLREHPSSSWLTVTDNSTFEAVASKRKLYDQIVEVGNKAEDILAGVSDPNEVLAELDRYKLAPTDIVDALNTYLEQVGTLKSKLFGFSGRVVVIENLNKQLRKSLPNLSLAEPEKHIETLEVMAELVQFIANTLAAEGLDIERWRDVLHIMQTDTAKLDEVDKILEHLTVTEPYSFMATFRVYEADNLVANIILLRYATELNRAFRAHPPFAKLFGFSVISNLLARPHEHASKINKLARELGDADQLNEARTEIATFVKTYPAASKRLGIIYNNGALEIIDETFANSDADYVKDYLAHKKKEQDIRNYFNAVTVDNFAKVTTELQQIMSIELQHSIDQGLVAATKADTQPDFDAARKALQRHNPLSIKQLTALLKAFPVIAGTINEISRSVPLDADQFDLVIVTDARSATIAEFLPVALRAKQVLLLADPAEAVEAPAAVEPAVDSLYRDAIARDLRNKLGGLSADARNAITTKQTETLIANLAIADFYRQYANYEQRLLKQFGVYEELSSFANIHFHDDALISLASRAKPVVDIISFKQVKPTLKQVTSYTNLAEVAYIIDQLQKLKDQDFTGTIGIITPFAEQAALLQKELDECVILDWFEQRELKVMTFDTCRHEHRDYVFYSLVASNEYNELSQKFPAQLDAPAYTGDTRAERLYSGLTVATQAVQFVHSLPLDSYSGALGKALQHFENTLQGTNTSIPVKGASPTTTDILLPTEANIAKAFEDSKFAKHYRDRITFMPKYQFANYVRALQPAYHKAQYKMFFLVMFDEEPIVIEFDEFKEHFLRVEKDNGEVGSTYLTAPDVYSHMVLETYGYRFLRLNKFNIGGDPTRTLDTHLSNIIRTPSWPADNGFVPAQQ